MNITKGGSTHGKTPRANHHRAVSVPCEVVRLSEISETQAQECWDIAQAVSSLLFDDEGPKTWQEFHAHLNFIAKSGVVMAALEPNGKVVGMQLMTLGPHRATLIGTFFRKESWGTGIAQKTLEATMALAGRRITATVFGHNKRCLNFATKRLGLQIEGVLKGHILQNNQPVDLYLLGLLR